jgi:hypothetical protein
MAGRCHRVLGFEANIIHTGNADAMSRWRREASTRLPELQPLIASKLVDSPMMLWVELNHEFERLCAMATPPLDLLKRVWSYGEWCLKHGNDDAQTAAALGFCEHLMDTPQRRAILPKIMQRSDFLGLRSLLERHNTSDAVDACLRELWQ